MESQQVSPDDLQMRRWLFRLKYSLLLRRRLRMRRDENDNYRTNPNAVITAFSLPYLSLQVIVSLTTLAYVCSHYQMPLLLHLGDDSIITNTIPANLNSPLKVGHIKAVLRQRGVSSEYVLERKDLELLAARTGDVTEAELSSALALDSALLSFNSTCDRDALLYHSLSLSSSSPSYLFNCPQSPIGGGMKNQAKSVVFDSTSLFVERIEDNRESLWILAAVWNNNEGEERRIPMEKSSAINPAIWGHLVNRFAMFDVRFGILLCDRLDSICKGHRFSSSNLVMALPNSIGHRKPFVKFQRFPLPQQQNPTCNEHSPAGRHICRVQLDQLAGWMQEVLSQGVAPLSDPKQLRLASNEPQWYWRRPQPLQLIWIPGQRFQNRIYPLTNEDTHSRLPLSLSALSIAYHDRAKFWRVKATSPSPHLLDASTQISSTSTPIQNILLEVGCRGVNVSEDHAHLILLTPEGICRLISTPLIYSMLNRQLRWSFPSVNDVFITGLVCLNTVLILVELLRLAVPYISLTWLLRRTRQKSAVAMPSQLRMRINIIVRVVRNTFAGWESYLPTPKLDNHVHSKDESISGRLWRLVEPTVNVISNLAIELLLANLVFLLAALPIVNLMDHALPCVNALLYLLRLCNLSLGFANLTSLVLLTVINVVIINKCKEVIHNIYKNRSAAVEKKKYVTSIPLGIQKLFKANAISAALTSPNSLARYLVLSDTEYSNESAPASPGYSDAELSSSSEFSASPPPDSIRENTTLEVARLLKKAMELERMAGRTAQQADENRILSQLLQVNGAPAKLFIWTLTRTKRKSRRLRHIKTSTSPQTNPSLDSMCVRKEEEANRVPLYDGEDEEEKSEYVGAQRVTRCRHRQRVRRSPSDVRSSCCLSSTTHSHPYDWPSWVIPCEFCVVCWRDFESGSRMAALSCGHGFHTDCLKQWLDMPGRTACPVCRWPANLPHAQGERQLIGRLVQTLIGWRDHEKSTSV